MVMNSEINSETGEKNMGERVRLDYQNLCMQVFTDTRLYPILYLLLKHCISLKIFIKLTLSIRISVINGFNLIRKMEGSIIFKQVSTSKSFCKDHFPLPEWQLRQGMC